MDRVFVYGSLQRGEANHRMMAGARFIARVRTIAAFELFDLGAFPAMTQGSTAIAGELYEVTHEMLIRLDVFEGCPALYQREVIALRDGTSAGAYVMPRQRVGRAPHIKVGCWRTWRSRSASQKGSRR